MIQKWLSVLVIGVCPRRLFQLQILSSQDLMVGDTIDVLGREIVLYDCDDFTRSFYRSYMGLEQD